MTITEWVVYYLLGMGLSAFGFTTYLKMTNTSLSIGYDNYCWRDSVLALFICVLWFILTPSYLIWKSVDLLSTLLATYLRGTKEE